MRTEIIGLQLDTREGLRDDQGMRTLGIILCTFLLSHTVTAGDTLSLTLRQAVETALKQNKEILIANLQKEQLENDYGLARAEMLPQLTIDARYRRALKRPKLFFNGTGVTIGFENNYTAALSFSQILFQGGRIWKALSAAKLGTQLGDEELQNVRTEIVFAVRQRFWAALLAEKQLEIAKKHLTLAEELLQIIQERYHQGLESDFALIRQEAQVSATKPAIVQAEADVALTHELLKNLLDIPTEQEILLEGTFPEAFQTPPPTEQLQRLAQRYRADYRAREIDVQIKEKEWQIAKSAYFPTVNAFANYSWEGQTDEGIPEGAEQFRSSNVGVEIEIPIFNGLETAHSVQKAKRAYEISLQQKEQMLQQIQLEIEEARLNYKKTLELMEANQKKLEQNEKALKIAKNRYDQGLLSQFEYNDTALGLFQAQLDYVQAVYEATVAWATLTRAVGLIDSEKIKP